MTRVRVKRALGLALALALVLPARINIAAAQDQTEGALPVCDRDLAILRVELQVRDSSGIDDPVSRIAVLIRAADLLWPHQQNAARETFTRAYDVAEKHFQEKGDENRREGRLRIGLEDQRFVVMAAIARRDAAWGRRLAERAAEVTRQEAEKEGASTVNRVGVTAKLLGMAASLLPADQQTAIKLARTTFRDPASESLADFLYSLAGFNQQAADQLYQDALSAYAKAPAREFLYLSSYPFASERVLGPEALATSFRRPQNFATNSALQRLFLQALLQRAEALVTTYEQPGGKNEGLPEAAQIYLALNAAEPLIEQYQPAYRERALTLEASVRGLLSSDVRQRLANRKVAEEDPSFEEYVEKADRAVGAANRDRLLVFAVLAAPDSETIDRVSSLAKKIDDSGVRQQLLDWFYFKRTRNAIRDGSLYEAKALAEKVDQLGHRAYLAYEIAAEALKKRDDQQAAGETLTAIVAAALKADNTNERARTLLGVAHLYAKFDGASAFTTMAEAIKTINRISEPDLTTTRIHQRIEGQTFAYYSAYEVAGFSLENAFRELAPFDLDRALLQATSLESKALRARAIVALSAYCLEKIEAQQKSTKPANKVHKNPQQP